MKLKGIAQRTGKSKNGRTYTEDSLDSAMLDYSEKINSGVAYGELGHPDTDWVELHLNRVSHRIKSMEIKWNRVPRKKKKRLKRLGIWSSWRGYNLKTYVSEVEILDTEMGRVVKNSYQSKKPLSLAVRSVGSVDSEGVCHVNKIISFDIVNTGDLAMNNGELKKL